MWNDIEKCMPNINQDVLFFYKNQFHVGSLIDAFMKPLKYKWLCQCCDILDMEKLEYGNATPAPIKFWMPLIKPIN